MTLPRSLGPYEILALIGHGGMGSLYRARDPGIGRDVAIRLLPGSVDSPERRDRLAREVRSAGALSHPNIAAIYDIGVEEGRPFVAMEYVPGISVAQLLQGDSHLTLDRTLRLIGDVCSGLAHGHRAGVVHRDIRPANLMVDREGTVKVLDFGMANPDGSGLGPDALNYKAPEQVTGASVDARADIFATGAVLYELLAHRPAFPGDGDVLHRIVNEEPQPLEQLRPDLDARIIRIVNQALAKSPGLRFPDIQSMQRELAAARLAIPEAGTQPAAGQLGADAHQRALPLLRQALELAPEDPRERWLIREYERPLADPPDDQRVVNFPARPAPAGSAAGPADQGTASIPETSAEHWTAGRRPLGRRLALSGALLLVVVSLAAASWLWSPASQAVPPPETPSASAVDLDRPPPPPDMPPAPAGTFVVRLTGEYPFEVLYSGGNLPADVAHRLTLPTGAQEIRLRNRDYFLDLPVAIDGQPNQTVTRTVPGLTTMTVWSSNETCEIGIDGRRVGYHPVTQRVAIGSHLVTIYCPNGTTKSQRVTLPVGPSDPVRF